MPELPEDPTIDAGGVKLRRLRAADAAALAAIRDDPLSVQWSHPGGCTLAEAEAAIAEADEQWRAGVAAELALEEDGVVVGSIYVRFYDPTRASVALDVAPASRGRGVATRAVAAACDWAFGTFEPLVRIELWALPGNEASLRVAERAGFRREGVFRSRLAFGGELRDVVVTSLLRDDPRPD